MAKHARQSDERLNDDAAIVAESHDSARADDASPDDANAKARRGRKPKSAIEPSDLQGLKYFDKLKPLLARLHEVGTKRDSAGNRDLHMDQYCLPGLLRMFSPLLTSMGALQKADERSVMSRTVESDRCYLMDRGYAKFLLWNVIHTAESS